MSNLYLHLSWFIFMFISFILALNFSLILSFMSITYLIDLDVFSISLASFRFSFQFDFVSCWFMTVVLLISSIVMFYSFFYMMPYYKSIYFLWMTFLFVVSMLLVITMSDFFHVMLGWDGLGLVSFFLIVFYQNPSSVTSGLFTLFMNRFGDGLFLVSIVFMCSVSPFFFTYCSFLKTDMYFFFLFCLSLCTKSALFPFSSWLPMAMAAPTPISALVHSSTLVTAGLYLMIRFSYFLYSCVFFMKFLVVFSVFTSFYAGMNSIFEVDLKKLIALSTLSHLGFIGLAFSSGFLVLSFFHLLTHALFKSLLFMAMGDIMISLNHSQDIRYLSFGLSYTPFSLFFMNISIMNLLGLPSMSGFFSKDLVLELFLYSFSGYFLVFLLYAGLFFTYFYSLKLFSFSYSFPKLVSFQMFHFPLSAHSLLLLVLSFFSVVFGKFFLLAIWSSMFSFFVPLYMKLFPLLFLFFIIMYVVLFLYFPVFLSYKIYLYFSSMMFLTFISMNILSIYYYKFSYSIVKEYELGFLNFFFHSSFPSFLMSTLLYIMRLYRVTFVYLILFVFFICLFI